MCPFSAVLLFTQTYLIIHRDLKKRKVILNTASFMSLSTTNTQRLVSVLFIYVEGRTHWAAEE